MSFLLTLTAMAIIFGLAYWIKNRGREKVVKTKHQTLHRLWLFPKGDHTRWEAEVDVVSEYSDKSIGIFAEDNYNSAKESAPTDAEVAFCKRYIFDLRQLFLKSKDGVAEAWKEWFRAELPKDWEKELKIDGFSVPLQGNEKNKWGITFYCDKASHFFNIAIEENNSKLESIDG